MTGKQIIFGIALALATLTRLVEGSLTVVAAKQDRRATQAVEIKPDYVPAHRHLAYALLRQGDLKGARQRARARLRARLLPRAAHRRPTQHSARRRARERDRR